MSNGGEGRQNIQHVDKKYKWHPRMSAVRDPGDQRRVSARSGSEANVGITSIEVPSDPRLGSLGLTKTEIDGNQTHAQCKGVPIREIRTIIHAGDTLLFN